MSDEIIDGRDELGVLLMGHDFKSWWTGSLLDIHNARKLVPHQQATTLQVAISVVAAAKWMIKNPRKGYCLPDDVDHEFIFSVSMPYIRGELSFRRKENYLSRSAKGQREPRSVPTGERCLDWMRKAFFAERSEE